MQLQAQPATPAPGGGGSSPRADWLAQQRGRSAVLYLAQISGAGADFYAAGTTYSLFDLFGRLKSKTYQVQLVAQFSSPNAEVVYDLGQRLSAEFTSCLFRPRPAFLAGHVACYLLTAPLLPWLAAEAGSLGLARTRVGMGRAAWLAKQRERKAVLYVVKIYNPDECFYKVGATFDLTARLSRLRGAYKWRTVARCSSWNAGKVWDLEQQLHTCFAHLSYTPSEPFDGCTECYAAVEEILAALPADTFFLKNTETLI